MQNQPRSNRYPLWLNTAINRYPADSNAASLPKFSSTEYTKGSIRPSVVSVRRWKMYPQATRKGGLCSKKGNEMNTTRIAIFIDGGYFDVTNRDECGNIKIDYAKLAAKLAGSVEILRTYYYNCLPYQQAAPTAEEAKRFSQAQKFHAALKALPRFEVREGMLVYRGNNEKGKPIYVQKGIDIQIGVDLVLLSAKQQISHAVVVAGDSDLIPALIVPKTKES